MTTDDSNEEIMRIQGELSAATTAISITLQLVTFSDAESMQRIKGSILEMGVDAASGSNIDDPHFLEGVERFKDRLLEVLPD